MDLTEIFEIIAKIAVPVAVIVFIQAFRAPLGSIQRVWMFIYSTMSGGLVLAIWGIIRLVNKEQLFFQFVLGFVVYMIGAMLTWAGGIALSQVVHDWQRSRDWKKFLKQQNLR
jgi:hypothetical protein